MPKVPGRSANGAFATLLAALPTSAQMPQRINLQKPQSAASKSVSERLGGKGSAVFTKFVVLFSSWAYTGSMIKGLS